MSKKSLADQLVRAGLVRAEETAEAKREQEWRERREKYAAEVAERMDEPPPPLWELPPKGKIVERGAAPDLAAGQVVCADCGEPFDPTADEHAKYGRADQCGPCARFETRR
jgi:formylmethanofuran dehydrogenase subunit E